MSGDELFEIVNEAGRVIGTAPRSQCHGNPALIHRSVHVVVFSSAGAILLQKRSMAKDIQPGKWDTAVGGHLRVGEDYEQGARREMGEELGVPPAFLEPLFDYPVRNRIESENVRVFRTVCDGPFTIQRSELDAVAFFEPDELKKRLEEGRTDDLTPVLRDELARLFRTEA